MKLMSVTTMHDQFLVFKAWKMDWFGISILVSEIILRVDE